jgi:hypothetical protein
MNDAFGVGVAAYDCTGITDSIAARVGGARKVYGFELPTLEQKAVEGSGCVCAEVSHHIDAIVASVGGGEVGTGHVHGTDKLAVGPGDSLYFYLGFVRRSVKRRVEPVFP